MARRLLSTHSLRPAALHLAALAAVSCLALPPLWAQAPTVPTGPSQPPAAPRAGRPKAAAQEPGPNKETMNPLELLTVHYHRPAGDYDGWTLWTWDNNNRPLSKEVVATGHDDYGLVFKVNPRDYGAGTSVGLLPRKGNWQDKESLDRIWSPALGREVWILRGRPELLTSRPDTSPWVVAAFLDSLTEVTLRLSAPIPADKIAPGLFSVSGPGGSKVPVTTAVAGTSPGARLGDGVVEVELLLGRPVKPGVDPVWQMSAAAKGYRPARLTLRRALDGPDYVSDVELGAIYAPAGTTFRVFAPTASAVTLNLYTEPVGGRRATHSMKPIGKGVWEAVVSGDLNGHYYTLSVSGRDPGLDPKRELIDPYSRCNTAHDGRGMVLHDTTEVTDRPAFSVPDAIIYEMHIRDFTVAPNSGIARKGKYLGVVEEGTRLPDDPSVKTGLDHLLEMGINTVQIMPFQDFENRETSDDYNWGYMPVHFNSPDGWYASEVHGPARVVEVKKMIDAFHKKGIRVVMDVVYNHTAEKRPDRIFSFEGLAPGYYYRLAEDGTWSDGSGTGNEFRSEAPMARKFILDSVKYWVREYKVDGFRFDLMGLIDTPTMIQIAAELHAIDPNLLIYGEPWVGGPTPITPTGKGTQKGKGFGVFGDTFRDALKGPVVDQSPGYVQTGDRARAVKDGLQGSLHVFAQDPPEAINYVECHDNHTLWDRLKLTTWNRPQVTDADRVKMDKMAAAAIFLAQGIPFLQCGQEMLRSKKGEDNSYNLPDAVNQIDWSLKKTHADVVDWYRNLIAFRKAHPMFRMPTAFEVYTNFKLLDDDLALTLPWNGVAFQMGRGASRDPWSAAVVLFNPETRAQTFPLPTGDWAIYLDDSGMSPDKPLRTGPFRHEIELPPRTVMVLAK